jgi:transglutaminase superfamily protein
MKDDLRLSVWTAMSRALAPAPLPPAGEIGLLSRARLAAEILAAYLPLARAVRSNDVRDMAAKARTVRRRRPSTPPEPEHDHETALRLARMVERTLSVLPTDNACLIRSLVTLRVLEHRAVPGRLVIGVMSDPNFTAHAWVEHDGTPVLEAGPYEPILEL